MVIMEENDKEWQFEDIQRLNGQHVYVKDVEMFGYLGRPKQDEHGTWRFAFLDEPNCPDGYDIFQYDIENGNVVLMGELKSAN